MNSSVVVILKKKEEIKVREKSMLNCQRFANIQFVLDDFLHYFLFYFSMSNIFTEFHTTH